jgi:hypothetical protein
MSRRASRFSRLTLAALVAAGGCASLPAPAVHRQADMAARFEQLLDSVKTASTLEADEVAGAPRIRLVVPPRGLAADQYVESSFHLSEDGYVLVVAVDMDRRVRVLYPESPDETGLALRSAPHRLTRFFSGFGPASGFGAGFYHVAYERTQRISPFGGTGVLLAVVSDRPLQFDRLIGSDGDWDEQALSRLVVDETISGAAYALGRATVLTGQEYNTDYTTFSGGRSFGVYAFASRLDRCDLGYAFGSSYDAYGYGWNRNVSIAGPRFVGLFQRNGQTFARYVQGGCAGASYYDVPVTGAPLQAPADSAASPDSSVKRKPLHPWAPRAPSTTADAGEAAGREVHVRLEPPSADQGRERPVTTAGLRFRTPGQLSEADARPAAVHRAPTEARVQRVPERSVEWQQLPERGLTPRAEPVREAPPAREAPVRAEPVRETPVRETPVREAPVRVEPVREPPPRVEPVQREPVQREPVERRSTPAAPITP